MKIHSLEELEKILGKETRVSVCLVMGPEVYQCRNALELIKSAVLAPGAESFDFTEFRAGEVGADQIVEAANTFPMLSRKRLVLVTDAHALGDSEQESLLEAADTISPRSLLVFYGVEFDRRTRFYREMQDKHWVAEFPKLKGPALERWAVSFLQRQGYRCSPAAIARLVALAGSDMQSVAGELEKLMLYAGSAKTIPDEAVDRMVGESRQQSIFELIDAVARRDRNASLRSLSNLLGMGEPPLMIVAMLARHCRQVLTAKDLLARGAGVREAAAAAQVPPFLADAFMRQARDADTGRMREMHIRLAGIDRKLKTSRADGRLLLENLICTLV